MKKTDYDLLTDTIWSTAIGRALYAVEHDRDLKSSFATLTTKEARQIALKDLTRLAYRQLAGDLINDLTKDLAAIAPSQDGQTIGVMD